MKKIINNCIPLFGIILACLCCRSALNKSSDLLFLLALLGIPVISNLVFIFANFKLNGSQKILTIDILSLLIQPLLLIVSCFFTNGDESDIAITILLVYALYTLVVDLIELFISFILHKFRKLNVIIYAVIITILFALFFLCFYTVVM